MLIVAIAIAYIGIGAELAAYTRGFDEGANDPAPAGVGDLLFIVLAWPLVLLAGLWRDAIAGDSDDSDKRDDR